MKENVSLISIIVPVYNVEKYLERCVNSILAQTYKNIELLLIDDGSVDNSPQICDDYVSRDARVSVYHKKNGGVSSARNYGIEKATGNYIAFIDSDDWIEPDYIENFNFDKITADLYLSGALYDIDDKAYSYKKYEKIYADNVRGVASAFFRQELKANGYPWGKLFSRKLICDNHMRFEEQLTINEDHIFIFEYLSHINSLYITDYAGYHYLVIDTTGRKLSSKINSCTELTTANEIFQKKINKLNKNWNLSENEYQSLKNDFVYGQRERVLRAALLLNDYQAFKEECIFWRTCNYSPSTKTFRIMILIIRSIRITLICFLLLMFLVKIKRRKRGNSIQDIYNDLASRSTIIEK